MASIEDQVLGTASIYLRELGWDVVVIGGISVQHQPGDRALNHELVVRFVGRPPVVEGGDS